MTTTRLALPLVLLVYFILAGATSAGAECAWVLWVESPMGSNQWSLSTSVTFVFNKRDQCERSARMALDAKVKRVEEEKKQWGGRVSPDEFWACLPDTIDPRGPKGGTR
jgi:hypothetical protein